MTDTRHDSRAEGPVGRLDQLTGLSRKEAALTLLHLLSGHRKAILAAGALALAETAVSVSAAWFAGILTKVRPSSLLLVGPLLGAAVLAGVTALGYVSTLLGTKAGARLAADTRKWLLERLALWPQIELDLAHRAGLLSRLAVDLSWATQVVGVVYRDLLTRPVVLTALAGVLWYLSGHLFFWTILGLAATGLPLLWLAKVSARTAERFVDLARNRFRLQSNILDGAAYLKLLGPSNPLVERYGQTETDYVRAYIRSMNASYATGPVAITGAALTLGLVTYLGWMDVQAGRMELGRLLSYLAATALFYRAAAGLAARLAGVGTAFGALSRVLALHKALEAEEPKPGLPPPTEPAAVAFESVTFRYPTAEDDVNDAADGEAPGDSRMPRDHADESRTGTQDGPDGLGPPVVEDLTFTADPGKLTVLAGPSGVGKTTLLKLAVGLYEPTDGRITWAGRPVSAYLPAAAPGVAALATQTPFILEGTVRENLTLFRQADDETLWEALERVGLADLFRHRPRGLDARLGEDGRNLSAGERRRLCLARCLAARPMLLVADEPTEALDRQSAALVIQALEMEARRGAAVLVSTHDEALCRAADELVNLNRTSPEGGGIGKARGK